MPPTGMGPPTGRVPPTDRGPPPGRSRSQAGAAHRQGPPTGRGRPQAGAAHRQEPPTGRGRPQAGAAHRQGPPTGRGGGSHPKQKGYLYLKSESLLSQLRFKEKVTALLICFLTRWKLLHDIIIRPEPWWLVGEGVKTTENKIHWPCWSKPCQSAELEN